MRNLAEVVRSLEGFDKKLGYLVKSQVRFVTCQLSAGGNARKLWCAIIFLKVIKI